MKYERLFTNASMITKPPTVEQLHRQHQSQHLIICNYADERPAYNQVRGFYAFIKKVYIPIAWLKIIDKNVQVVYNKNESKRKGVVEMFN